jgi:hypothetical protein
MKEVTITKYTIPTELEPVFERRPILLNESAEEYDRLRDSIVEMMEPTNISEWMLVLSVVRYNWEDFRLGNMKAALVNLTWKEAVRIVMEALVPGDAEQRARKAQELSGLYFRPEGHGQVLAILAGHKLTEAAIAAQAMAVRLPEIEVLDRQSQRASLLRMAIERDLLHHRAVGSWKRAEKVLAVIDARADPISLSPSLEEPALSP